MTSSGRTPTRPADEEFRGNFELIDRSTDWARCEDGSEDGSYPSRDASLLRADEHEDGSRVRGNSRSFFQRLFAIMSLTPLVRRDSAFGSSANYGALSNGAESSPDVRDSDDVMISNDDVPKKDKRNGKGTAIRAASFAFGSQRHRDNSIANSRNKPRRSSLRSSSHMLIAEPGHPAGQGGYLGGGLPVPTSEESEDEEEAIVSRDDDDAVDPPDNSPYPQVRASVAATDDTSLSINTPRMWILSLLCAFLGSATNLFFSLRYPSVAITPVIALVVVHPLGRLWDKSLKSPDDPAETFEYGDLRSRAKLPIPYPRLSRRQKLRLWLAQGNWNGKEHACVYISSNVSFGFAFATDVIVEQSKFYHQDLSIIYQLLLTISTQILGYAFAGLTRRFLVRPPSMIWPGTLMSTAMFTTMHSPENKSANGWVVSRWKFFLLVWSGAFAWYSLPGLLMPALSYFSIITWFSPKNVVIANLVSRLQPSRLPWADTPSSAFRPA